jgi:hypothetical protein
MTVTMTEELWTPAPGEMWGALRSFVGPYVGASFTVPGDPVPKKRRVGMGRGAFTPAATVKAEKAVKAAFSAALPGWVAEPDRTYGVLVEFRTGSGSLVDIDNATKLVLDALNKVFWQDDIQVGDMFSHLVRGRGEPGVEVLLFAVQPNGTQATRLCECGTRYRSGKKMCGECVRRRAIVNSLLTGDDSAAEAAEQLDRDRRAVFSHIAACMIGSNRSPSVASIARHITAVRGEPITDHRVRAVVDTLTSDGYLTLANGRLRIVKPLGAA